MKFFSSDTRTNLIYKNIVVSLFAKGWSALIVLLMVPLTLRCLGAYQNGVWLTISSLLVWIDQMDIGLGNGLRNRLAAHIAHNEMYEARKAVSSTFAMLFCIVLPVLLLLLLLIWQTDVYAFFNVVNYKIPELRLALTSAVILVCMTFVLKFIGNVYMGMQQPAASNLLIAIGQSIALLSTWLLYVERSATFFLIVIVNTAAPLLTYLLAYPYTFFRCFPMLRPSLSYVSLRTAKSLGNVGVKFFWLQISGVVQFMTANILISHFFSPEMVTPYQISYRYMSLMLVVFTIVATPYWNATTDAYERGDIRWIKTSANRLNRFLVILFCTYIVMVSVSTFVYDIWIGDQCSVPMSMTILVGLYIYMLILSSKYAFFLNGIGALRLQLLMTVMTVLFIPAEWLVNMLTHSINWFIAVMGLCMAPCIVVNMIQFNKIINGTAKGIWRI